MDAYECVVQWQERFCANPEVAGSNPMERVASQLCVKMRRLDGLGGGWLASGSHQKQFFSIYFNRFNAVFKQTF
jgi:hypothetical protein